MSSSPSLQLIKTIYLPKLAGEPGPIHTLIQDEKENLYYSDEINHSIVCLTKTGDMLWNQHKTGNAATELNYPKGMDLGSMLINGIQTKSLAICDSWNGRIQFFDRNGSYLTSWSKIGNIDLKEVQDIRFIAKGSNEMHKESYWLILDRSHHSLFCADMSGNLISGIGRAFPHALETRWPLPSDNPLAYCYPYDSFCECLPYDPLFMPSRIFGYDERALFILEPKLNRLKHILSGNALPVWIKPPAEAEWIGANEKVLLCYDKCSGMLSRYSDPDRGWESVPIQGVPVPNCSAQEIWTQEGSQLQCWIWQQNYPNPKDSWIVKGITEEIAFAMQTAKAPECGKRITAAVSDIESIGRNILRSISYLQMNSVLQANEQDNLPACFINFDNALSQIQQVSYIYFLSAVKITTLQYFPNSDVYITSAADRLKSTIDYMISVFKELLLLRDEWLVAQLGIQDTEQTANILQLFSHNLMQSILGVSKWLWWVPLVDGSLCVPEAEFKATMPQKELPSPAAFNKSSGCYKRTSNFLREIDRIYLGGHCTNFPVSPANICYDPEFGFLVSLNAAGSIVNLDNTGKYLRTISLTQDGVEHFENPYGISVDNSKRIWVSQPALNLIEILDFRSKSRFSIETLIGVHPNLQCPIGLYNLNGLMMVADTHHNRIVAITADGRLTVLFDKPGRNRGELTHPLGFCTALESNQFWVVDLRNHRLQKLSLKDGYITEIGSPGLGRNEVVLPESAAVFGDGVIAVSQWACHRAIKLFSADGKELETLELDYLPWGVTTHESVLLVCEKNGNYIRVYDRI